MDPIKSFLFFKRFDLLRSKLPCSAAYDALKCKVNSKTRNWKRSEMLGHQYIPYIKLVTWDWTAIDVLYTDLRPSQTCHSKVMHRKEVTHSDGSFENKSRRRPWLKKWDKVKIPWYTHRLMHRKRVTCELHDSYFCLMTIKHAIPKILRGRLNYYITLWRQKVSELEIKWVGDKM